jgi:hypothetical protein
MLSKSQLRVFCLTLLLLLVAAVVSLALVCKNDHKIVNVGIYKVMIAPKAASEPLPGTTLGELQANPNVVEIFWDEPQPGQDADHLLWSDWTPKRGYIHNHTPYIRGQ